jgi:hypothetical protein
VNVISGTGCYCIPDEQTVDDGATEVLRSKCGSCGGRKRLVNAYFELDLSDKSDGKLSLLSPCCVSEDLAARRYHKHQLASGLEGEFVWAGAIGVYYKTKTSVHIYDSGKPVNLTAYAFCEKCLWSNHEGGEESDNMADDGGSDSSDDGGSDSIKRMARRLVNGEASRPESSSSSPKEASLKEGVGNGKELGQGLFDSSSSDDDEKSDIGKEGLGGEGSDNMADDGGSDSSDDGGSDPIKRMARRLVHAEADASDAEDSEYEQEGEGEYAHTSADEECYLEPYDHASRLVPLPSHTDAERGTELSINPQSKEVLANLPEFGDFVPVGGVGESTTGPPVGDAGESTTVPRVGYNDSNLQGLLSQIAGPLPPLDLDKVNDDDDDPFQDESEC